MVQEDTRRNASASTLGVPKHRVHTDNPDAYIAGDRRRALGDGRVLPDRVQGAAIFVDISGFTPLTEALARSLGPLRGAEELSRALDVVFDAVLGELHRFMGSVIYFSGDAVTCWLDGDDGLRAVACGLAMQRAMATVSTVVTPDGTTVQLGMKVAVAAGRARRFVVGDPAVQRIDVLAGALMDRLAAAEHQAQRDEVVADGPTLEALSGRVEITRTAEDEEGSRFGVVSGLLVDVGALPAPRPYPRLPRAVVREWLLPAVYERMSAGKGEFLSELRPAVPLFVRFGGIDYDEDEDAPGKLDEFIRRVQWVIDGHGGNLLQLTIGDKGAYLYAVFGSPQAHEDDAARASAAALDILALDGVTAATGFQVGVATGRLRSGTYGHRQRRTFCCLGDAVNLAARLMSAAPVGAAYVTGKVALASSRRFELEHVSDMTVKGKSEPVPVHRLIRQKARRAVDFTATFGPLVGREEQLDHMVALAEQALDGRGQVVALCAEAGMGKSSLTAALCGVLGERGVPVHMGAATSVGGAASYVAWQPIASSLLGLTESDDTPEAVASRLEEVLGAADPDLLPRLPLLGTLLGVPLPDNELTEGFDAKLRKTSLESMALELLSSRAARAPFAIVVEDCHWLDALSADLLGLVARAAASWPLLLVLTYRPGPFRAEELDHTSVVDLPGLDDLSSGQVLRSRLASLYGETLVPSRALVERLVARAEGNPFYLEELANYLHAAGADPADAGASSVELPSSLATLVLSRIDTLSEPVRRTLKVASVVGRDFAVDALAGSYPGLGAPRRVTMHLRALCDADLVVPEDLAAGAYAFRHAVIQEVTYESIPFSLRSTVHGRVGAWIEATDPGSLDLLAHHYWNSREEAKKREFLRKAGDAAKARFANQAAADYYRRLSPLVEDDERVGVLADLGAVLEVQGDWPEAVKVRSEAIGVAELQSDPGRLGWAHATLAGPLWKQGMYEEARDTLQSAGLLFTEVGDLAGLAWVENARGIIAQFVGRPDEAWDHLQSSLELRRRHGDRALLPSVLINLGVGAMDRGDYETARRFTEESLAIKTELGARNELSLVHNNLGMIAYLEGDFERAVPHLEEAVRVGRENGSAGTVAMAEQNLGNCARELRRADEAREHYGAALDVFAAAREQRLLYILFQDVAMLVASTEPGPALRMLGAADAVREAMEATRPDHEEAELDGYMRPARAGLGPDAADEEARGRALTLDAAIALCRELCGRPE